MTDIDDAVDSEQGSMVGVRLVVLNLPEDEGEGLGFRLTRTLWDPYPWVRDVTPDSRADASGLKTGDCILQTDGMDLLGLPIGQVAGLIRGDGSGRGVSLLLWNCGVDPNDDPELLWSCGGGSRGEKSRRALAGVVKALSCCVCAATATKALNCARSHLYCEACWSRLQRCALCREPLPPKESPYAKNLVAEQVFEAIAAEYEIKATIRKPTTSTSAYTSPNRSPNMSPTTSRKGQYQMSILKSRRPDYASDTNINNITKPNASKSKHECSMCHCHKKQPVTTDNSNLQNNCHNLLQHKLVARLRPACSLADLQNASFPTCHLSKSMNNINLNENGSVHSQSTSINDLKDGSTNSNTSGCNESPVFVLAPPPIYVLACEHEKGYQ